MRRRLVFFLIVGLLFFDIYSKDDYEVIVETYEDESMTLLTDESFKKEDDIARFLELIETSPLAEEDVEGRPDYVIMVNDRSELTLVAMVNVWIGEESEIRFTRGVEGTDVFEVDAMYTDLVNELLP